MTRTAIHTANAPAAIGTYSQAIKHGDTVYISGQIPVDPATGEVISDDIAEQIEQVFKNLTAVAEAAGSASSPSSKSSTSAAGSGGGVAGGGGAGRGGGTREDALWTKPLRGVLRDGDSAFWAGGFDGICRHTRFLSRPRIEVTG